MRHKTYSSNEEQRKEIKRRNQRRYARTWYKRNKAKKLAESQLEQVGSISSNANEHVPVVIQNKVNELEIENDTLKKKLLDIKDLVLKLVWVLS